MRVCLDTNILVSALLAPSLPAPPSTILRRALEGDFDLVISETTLTELRSKFDTKPYLATRVSTDEVERFVSMVVGFAAMIPKSLHPIPRIVRDIRDDYLLAPAILEQVDYVVSGDKDLLVLGEIAGVRIVNPAAFVAILDDTAEIA